MYALSFKILMLVVNLNQFQGGESELEWGVGGGGELVAPSIYNIMHSIVYSFKIEHEIHIYHISIH